MAIRLATDINVSGIRKKLTDPFSFNFVETFFLSLKKSPIRNEKAIFYFLYTALFSPEKMLYCFAAFKNSSLSFALYFLRICSTASVAACKASILVPYHTVRTPYLLIHQHPRTIVLKNQMEGQAKISHFFQFEKKGCIFSWNIHNLNFSSKESPKTKSVFFQLANNPPYMVFNEKSDIYCPPFPPLIASLIM